MNLEKKVLFVFFGALGLLALSLMLSFIISQTELSLQRQVSTPPSDVVLEIAGEDLDRVNIETDDYTSLDYLPGTVQIVEFDEDLVLSAQRPINSEFIEQRPITPEKRTDTKEKYYVAEGTQCQVIRYACESGWDYFSDEVGCGCEKVVEPELKEVKNTETLDYPIVKSDWGQNLNPAGEAPLNQWQAFYFSATNPNEVVKTEVVDRLSVNFNWSDMDIESEEFAAYWVGDWEFEEETVWAINVSQGWSKARIFIDDRLVYAGDSSAELLHVFTAGTHRIEVEYLNAWHTVDFSANFGEPVERISKERLPEWIKLNRLDSLSLGLVSVYESNSFDTRIPISFADKNEPVLLLLSSYSGVEWNLDLMPEWVRGVVVASYENSTRAVGVPASVPLIYLNDYLDLPYRLQPECSSFGGYSHCEHTGLVGIDAVIEPLFATTPKYFSGAYNTPGLMMPDLSISDDLRNNIRTSYEKWKDQQRNEAKKKTDFEGLFD
ncbi:hypothetical protein GW756_05365 [bacterium]|nr:hypothetical protein [bacterium]NCQ55344.1 hypothetical protein [Candidatus Parcubacteria bacterium]NCS67143.1 hypothetical protein [Candidatus Peregrinibacteria bacterium]NCS96769.1 hypothetical protein [bacterium]